MVLSGKRAKREADSASNIKKDEASDNIEVGTRPSSITSTKENAKNSNVVCNVTNNDLTPPPKGGPKDHCHSCRFCDKTFEKSQALGGHMNKHRAEKEEEGLRKAQSLVESKQQILFGSIPWPNYAGRGGGAGNHSFGQSLSSNAHIVGTSTTPQAYSGNQSAPSIQQNQIQMNQSAVLPQQQNQVHGGGVNIIRGSHLRSLENTRTHHGTPASQTDVSIVTGQHQTHHAGVWVNSGQMAYPGQHGGTDFHVQLNQLHQQAGPSQLQSLQDMAQSASNVPMASAYAHQYSPLQEHQATNVQFVELAQIQQPVQYYYEVAHPHSNQYSQNHFHAPKDGSQTSIDEKSDHESLRNHDQSVGTSGDNCNQTPEHDHRNLQEGTADHHNADPVGECGAETPNDSCKVGDSAHGLILQ